MLTSVIIYGMFLMMNLIIKNRRRAYMTTPTPQEMDLLKRAIAATELGVSVGAFARSQGMSYREMDDLLKQYGVRKETRTRLVAPTDLAELLAA